MSQPGTAVEKTPMISVAIFSAFLTKNDAISLGRNSRNSCDARRLKKVQPLARVLALMTYYFLLGLRPSWATILTFVLL